MPDGAIKADRSTIYGNPWVAGDPHGALLVPAPVGGQVTIARHRFPGPLQAAEAVAHYRAWLGEGAVALPPDLSDLHREMALRALDVRRTVVLSRAPQLVGRQLACWCTPGAPCHADALMAVINA